MTSNDKKILLFLLLAAAAVAMAFFPLRNLVRHGRPSDYYSHIPVIPAVSAYYFFRRRKRVFRGERPSLYLGLAAMAGGVGLFLFGAFIGGDLIRQAAVAASAGIVFLSGSFVMLFGIGQFRRAYFPFAFLLFMISLPLAVMERIVSALVGVSTGVTHLLFKGFGVPFVQEGAYFHLPVFNIEVAEACSGIRSSIALLITTVLAGHLYLNKFWKELVLALAVFPVTVFKNGVRIITLYLLSYFIDMRIIEGGFFHKSGGFIFFGLGLVLLACVLWILIGPRVKGPDSRR